MSQVRIRSRRVDDADVPHVLWAEDNAQDQILIAEALRTLPVRVEFVTDGVLALEALRRRRPDLLVLDLRMPRLGGLEALRQVRGDPALRDVRACVFSAGNQPDEVAACRALGALAVVQKPVDFDRFELAVRGLLEHARSVVA